MKAPPDHAKGYRRLIPSMTALIQFEAVGRLRSFTQAAAELGVTQAAVSRQIRLLEESLDVRLLDRLHRTSELTREGEALHAVVAEAMKKIAGAFDRLSSVVQETSLAVSSTAAFSHFCLMPALQRLKATHPTLSVRLMTELFLAEVTHTEVDFVVRFGGGDWSDGTSTLLFSEEVFPVCSPAWRAEHGEPASLEALTDATLVAYDPTSDGWLTWEEWFRALGAAPGKLRYGLRACLYTDAIQGVLQGQGVALGWGRLVRPLLASGQLVRLTDAVLPLREAYYIVMPHGRTVTPMVSMLIELLRHPERDPA